MNLRKLEETIDMLAVFINISQEQKNDMLERYSKLSDNEIMRNLAIKVYQLVGPKSPYYDYALSAVKNYNYFACPSVDEMKELLEKEFTRMQEQNIEEKSIKQVS